MKLTPIKQIYPLAKIDADKIRKFNYHLKSTEYHYDDSGDFFYVHYYTPGDDICSGIYCFTSRREFVKWVSSSYREWAGE